MRLSPVVGLLSLIIAGPVPLWAQSTGSIRGQVTDPSGKSIPDAAITAVNSRGAARTAKTGVQGQYQLNLEPGTYTVRVAAKGFAPAEFTQQVVSAGMPVCSISRWRWPL